LSFPDQNEENNIQRDTLGLQKGEIKVENASFTYNTETMVKKLWNFKRENTNKTGKDQDIEC